MNIKTFNEILWTYFSSIFRLFANQHILFFYLRLFSVCSINILLLFSCYEKLSCCFVTMWGGILLCGFVVSLTFTYAIIVGINVDLLVWFCQNLMWTIFCLFFLQVINWFVWHFCNCFHQTFSRPTRICIIFLSFVQYNRIELYPTPRKYLTSCNYVIKYPLSEIIYDLNFYKFTIKEVLLWQLKMVNYTWSWILCHYPQIPITFSCFNFITPKFSLVRRF